MEGMPFKTGRINEELYYLMTEHDKMEKHQLWRSDTNVLK